jgi:hypothetical protein
MPCTYTRGRHEILLESLANICITRKKVVLNTNFERTHTFLRKMLGCSRKKKLASMQEHHFQLIPRMSIQQHGPYILNSNFAKFEIFGEIYLRS